MYYIESESFDPSFNLALEECLFSRCDEEQSIFMLWQNDHTIVVGKYQNTVEEINHDFVKENSIKVVRRITGGGAVYHDLGNLNFSLIRKQADAEAFDFSSFTQPVVKALEKLNIKAENNSRNDLCIDGKKFSGNAQLIRSGKILHHGTLLFNSNLEFIQEALQVKPDKYESKGIKSVRSRVTNIADHMKERVDLSEFKKVLVETMSEYNNLTEYKPDQNALLEIGRLRDEKYTSWDWNYGRSIQYNVRKERRFAGGTVSISLNANQGRIAGLMIHGDFFGNGELRELEEKLIGMDLNDELIARTLNQINLEHYMSGIDAYELAALIAF